MSCMPFAMSVWTIRSCDPQCHHTAPPHPPLPPPPCFPPLRLMQSIALQDMFTSLTGTSKAHHMPTPTPPSPLRLTQRIAPLTPFPPQAHAEYHTAGYVHQSDRHKQAAPHGTPRVRGGAGLQPLWHAGSCPLAAAAAVRHHEAGAE